MIFVKLDQIILVVEKKRGFVIRCFKRAPVVFLPGKLISDPDVFCLGSIAHRFGYRNCQYLFAIRPENHAVVAEGLFGISFVSLNQDIISFNARSYVRDRRKICGRKKYGHTVRKYNKKPQENSRSHCG